jgi:hypothetical protein
MNMKRIAFIVLLCASALQAQTTYLQNIRNQTKAQLSQIVSGVTIPNKAFFEDRIFQLLGVNFGVSLELRGLTPYDLSTFAAAKDTARARNRLFWIPGSYTTTVFSPTSADSNLIAWDMRLGKWNVYGTRMWGYKGVAEIDTLTRLKKMYDSLATGGKILLGNGHYSTAGIAITTPVTIEGTGNTRPATLPTWPYRPGGAVIASSASSTSNDLIDVNRAGVDFRNVTLLGNNRTNGRGFYLHSPSATTVGDVNLYGVASYYNGLSGFYLKDTDGITVQDCDAFHNKEYGIWVGGGIASKFIGGRTRDNTLGGFYSYDIQDVNINGVECIRDSTNNAVIRGPDGGFAASATLTNCDFEFALPRSGAFTTRAANLRLKNLRHAILISNRIGSKHTESSTYAATVGTGVDTIYCASVKAGVNDYYNDGRWYVNNTTRGSGEVKVTDFIVLGGGTIKKLKLQSSIASQAAGDVFSLIRRPNAIIEMDSVDCAVMLNNNIGYTGAHSDTIVASKNYSASLWIGGTKTTDSDFDPLGTDIKDISGTSYKGELLISKTGTGGELWLKSSHELEIESRADSVLIRSTASGINIKSSTQTKIEGSNILLAPVNRIGLLATTSPQHPISVYDATPRMLFTNTGVNTNISSPTQAADSASIDINSGNSPPRITFTGIDGDQFYIDISTEDIGRLNGGTRYQFDAGTTIGGTATTGTLNIDNDVDGTADSSFVVNTNGGVVVGNPTGGNKGPGTVNATAVYDDNTLLTDYVFESDYKLSSIDSMRAYFEAHKHLPTIAGRKEWEKNGKPPLGKLVNQIWETVEVQARYIAELEERIKKLESE